MRGKRDARLPHDSQPGLLIHSMSGSDVTGYVALSCVLTGFFQCRSLHSVQDERTQGSKGPVHTAEPFALSFQKGVSHNRLPQVSVMTAASATHHIRGGVQL